MTSSKYISNSERELELNESIESRFVSQTAGKQLRWKSSFPTILGRARQVAWDIEICHSGAACRNKRSTGPIHTKQIYLDSRKEPITTPDTGFPTPITPTPTHIGITLIIVSNTNKRRSVPSNYSFDFGTQHK